MHPHYIIPNEYNLLNEYNLERLIYWNYCHIVIFVTEIQYQQKVLSCEGW